MKKKNLFGVLFGIGLGLFVFGSMRIQAEEVSSKDALDQVIEETTDEGSVVVDGDIKESGTVTINSGQSFTFLSSEGQKVFNPAILVEEGAKLTLDGDILYKGGITNKGWLVVNHGEFTSRISNEGKNAQFEMNDGDIHDVTVTKTLDGALSFKDGATGEMNGGVIRKNYVASHHSGTVFVYNGSSFVFNDGLIGGTEDGNACTQYNDVGAGVYVYSNVPGATSKDQGKQTLFTMNGGSISGNGSMNGGGVFVDGGSYNGSSSDVYSLSTFIMNGGTISHNQAQGAYWSSNLQGGGGGVFVHMAAQFIMNGGLITANDAFHDGGGVATYDEFVTYFGKVPYDSIADKTIQGRSLRDWANFFPAAFEMNGGTISLNHAYQDASYAQRLPNATGGGVYVGSNNVAIRKGVIENNFVYGQGGGIYVASVPYTVYLNRTLVTKNTGSFLGGGIWFCPDGDVVLNLNDTLGIYDNVSNGLDPKGNPYVASGYSFKGSGDDIVVIDGDGRTTLINRLLGGGEVKWYKDGEINSWDPWAFPHRNPVRYDATVDTNTLVSNVYESASRYLLKAVAEEETKSLAEKSAVVRIQNNWAWRGGGIAANGAVIFGEEVEVPATYTVTKVWGNPEATHPESVTVWLMTRVDGVPVRVERALLNDENEWTYSFTGLPTNVEYYVEEEMVSGWVAETVSQKSEATTFVTISNFVSMDYGVKKVWESVSIPNEVHVSLMNEKDEVVDTVVLNNENNWEYTFENLSSGHVYRVVEEALDGWKSSYEHTSTFTTITNTPIMEYVVQKVWDVQDVSNIPSSITVELLDADNRVVDTVVLSAENEWMHTFEGLNANTSYRVREIVLDGWSVRYEVSDHGTTIVNGWIPEEEPEEPTKPEEPSKPEEPETRNEEPKKPSKPQKSEKLEKPEKPEAPKEESEKRVSEIPTSTQTNVWMYVGVAMVALVVSRRLRVR